MTAAVGACAAVVLAWQLWPESPYLAAAGAPAYERTLSNVGEPVSPISPIPTPTGLDLREVALGRRLFHDPQLSRDNTVSCASCHSLRTAGVDGRPRSIGIDGREGERNAPTVFNACLNYRQFWDGRAGTLQAQIDGPLTGHAEMDSSWAETTRKLRRDPEYVRAFGALYPEGVQPKTARQAIATFERSLATPDAPFDAYLKGDRNAISPLARRGYQHFTEYGCVSCHQGRNVGGNLMQPFGVMLDPGAIRSAAERGDRMLRLADIQQNAGDSGPLYKVPSLRNVARTAPYFHNGSESSLSGAIRVMGIVQLGRRLPDGDVAAIQAFLESLTGRYEGKPL